MAEESAPDAQASVSLDDSVKKNDGPSEPASDRKPVEKKKSGNFGAVMKVELLEDKPREEPPPSHYNDYDEDVPPGGCGCFGGGGGKKKKAPRTAAPAPKPQEVSGAAQPAVDKTKEGESRKTSILRRRMSAGSAACVSADPDTVRRKAQEALQNARQYAEEIGHEGVTDEDSKYHGAGETQKVKKKGGVTVKVSP